MKKEVVITGVGLISAAGTSAAETWQALKEGKSGLSPFSLFSSTRYAGIPAGQLPAGLSSLSGLGKASRPDHLAVIAARQALKESFQGAALPAPEKAGVILGACVGGMAESELYLQRLPSKAYRIPGSCAFTNAPPPPRLSPGHWVFSGPARLFLPPVPPAPTRSVWRLI